MNSTAYDCKSCGSEMQVVGQGADMRMECPRCQAVISEPPVGCPQGDYGFRDEVTPKSVKVPTAGQENMAAFLAGALWFAVGGFIIGGISSGWQPQGLGLGVLIGVVLGLFIGSKIARFDTVIGGGFVCGILPIILCLKDSFRRGHKIKGMEEFLVPAAIMFGVGFAIGVLLVGTKKIMLRAIVG